ncbi:hypothetical protein [Achromobacter phage tuull]|nr:hypothetical protein [Achromobacter phage tuull]
MLLSSHYAIDSRLSEASRQHVSPASPNRYTVAPPRSKFL